MSLRSVSAALLLCGLHAAADLPPDYRGLPFEDSVYKAGPQKVPGRLQTALFDRGGEGIAYHDTHASNQGSGNLNRRGCPDNASYYVCRFREAEGVDISYIKSTLDHLDIDRSRTPPLGLNYIGWEEDGEWINYTVQVAAPGAYRIAALHGSLVLDKAAGHNAITLAVNGKAAAACRLKATGGPHFWVQEDSIGVIAFKEAGVHLLTLNVSFGNNIAYLDFVPVKGTPTAAAPQPGNRRPGAAYRAGRRIGGRVTFGIPGERLFRSRSCDASGREADGPWKPVEPPGTGSRIVPSPTID